MITCRFNNTITERDMDMLLAQAITNDLEFCRFVVNKTDCSGKEISVKRVELSKEDSNLGESDVTVVLDIDGTSYGLLIEDKIDAVAMPNQHARYVKRGDKGIEDGDYKQYAVFIFCPEKYYKNNSEAKLYEHLLTYEECRDYFERKNDALSQFWSQQLSQAISKAKKPASINVDEKANSFLRQYIQYQRENYPGLDLSTKEDKNGWWTDFRTELGYVYINHKIQEGYVDLTFPKAVDKVERAKLIAEWARHHKMSEISVVKATKSVMLRIHVPKLDILKGFEFVDSDELKECFDAIQELTDFANIIEVANSITER